MPSGDVPPPRRVLVVDDHALTASSLAEVLRRAGSIEVATAGTVAAALEWLGRPEPFDLVLLDFALPDGDGLEVLRAARKLRPTPCVIFISQAASPAQAAEIVMASADAYLAKPFTHHQLFCAWEDACRPGHIYERVVPVLVNRGSDMKGEERHFRASYLRHVLGLSGSIRKAARRIGMSRRNMQLMLRRLPHEIRSMFGRDRGRAVADPRPGGDRA